MYFFYVIGTWKVLGAIAILLPRMPLIKERAYAGLFFVMTGAFITHIAIGDPVSKMISSVVFMFFIVISWYLRPYSRKIAHLWPKL